MKSGIAVAASIIANAALRAQPASSFLVALHVDGLAWFRSPDFHDPTTELLTAIHQPGTFSLRADRLVDTRPPVKQTIQALDERRQPRPGLEMRIHTFVSIQSRCEVRMEFDDPSFGEPQGDDVHNVVTGGDGRAEF